RGAGRRRRRRRLDERRARRPRGRLPGAPRLLRLQRGSRRARVGFRRGCGYIRRGRGSHSGGRKLVNIRLVLLVLCFLSLPAAATHEPWKTERFPQDEDKAWWDDAWWERGWLPVSATYEVASRTASFRNAGTEVPVEIFTPKGAAHPPVVVFLHG